MDVELCDWCEAENTEGYLVETPYGPAGLYYDCVDALAATALDDGAAERA